MNPDETYEVCCTFRIAVKAKDKSDAEAKALTRLQVMPPVAEEFVIQAKLVDYDLPS